MADIKVCENNFAQGTDEMVDRLKDEGIEVEVEPCLGYCGDCATGPFAVVDDELFQAETPDELYEMIKEHL